MRIMRRESQLALGWLVLLSQLGLTVGCGEEFAPYNRLESLRVLAIQADPVAPAPGETTLLTPLVYAPPEQGEVEYAWSWCPLAGNPAEGYPCLVDEEMLRAIGGDQVPAFDLGTELTANFEHSLDPALLRQLCDGIEGVPLLIDCTGGFPVLLQLTVRTSDEELRAVQTLRLRLDDDEPVNQHPRVDGLTAVAGGQVRALDDTGEVSLPRLRDNPLFAEVSQDSAELYQGRNEEGEVVELRERLTLTWFVEAGKTRSMRTSFIEGAIPLHQAVENRWRPGPSSDYADDQAQLIVVIRDNRGGVSWRRALVSLEAGR